MRRNICSRSIAFVVATFLRVTTIAIAVSSLASLGQANSMERTTSSEGAPDQIVSNQEVMPLDAFGYLGGLFESPVLSTAFDHVQSARRNPRGGVFVWPGLGNDD